MKKIKILSIDGGGIKGIIPAKIINEIEVKLQSKHGNKNLKISDFFDVIAGTSTGGILACLYLLDNYNGKKIFAKDVISIYKEKSSRIFDLSFIQRVKTLYGLTEKKYNDENFEEVLKEVLGDKTLSSVDKIGIITSYDITQRKMVVFNSLNAKENPQYDFYLRDVVRATTAAPTYFSPAKIYSMSGKSHTCIDGFVASANPSMTTFTESRCIDFSKVFNDRKLPKYPNENDIILVSIGTGFEQSSYLFDEMKNKGILGWIRPIIDMSMSGSTEMTHDQLKNIFSSITPPHNNFYFRIDPSKGKASHELDDVSINNIINLENAADNYINTNQTFIDNIVKLLLQNK